MQREFTTNRLEKKAPNDCSEPFSYILYQAASVYCPCACARISLMMLFAASRKQTTLGASLIK